MIKKLLFAIIMGILFIFAIAIVIGGFNNTNSNMGEKNTVPEDLSKYDINPTDITFDKKNGGGETIKVYLVKENKIKALSLEDYTRGVVCAEMPAEFNIEAIKAQAIAARTFAMAHMEAYGGKKYEKAKGADVTDNEKCQVYIDKDSRLRSWPAKQAGQYWNKITEAVQATEGQIIKYNGKLVMEPYYFAISSGKTEDCVEVFGDYEPYLKSVVSPGEEIAPKYKSQVKVSYNSFISNIEKEYANCNINFFNVRNEVKIIKRTTAGSVNEVKIGKEIITGSKFRNLMKLNSANFDIIFNLTNVEIDCIGYGHDVGMSQWGANVMAKGGKNYKDILTHYYRGVTVEKMNN